MPLIDIDSGREITRGSVTVTVPERLALVDPQVELAALPRRIP